MQRRVAGRATPGRPPDFSAQPSSVVFMKPLSHSTTHPRQFIFSFALFGRSVHKWSGAGRAVQGLAAFFCLGGRGPWELVCGTLRPRPSCPARFLFPFSGFAFPLAFGEQLGAQILQVSCHLQLQGRPLLWPKPSSGAGLCRWPASTGDSGPACF